MKILVTGSSGLIGSGLIRSLSTQGDAVLRLGRARRGARQKMPDQAIWNPETGFIESDRLKGIDAAVHLAGESVANRPWIAAKKRRILDSRVQGTRLLADTLAALDPKPKVLLSASATGFYGHRGEQILDETSAPGEGFLAEVCTRWEEATRPATEAGIRVVHLRIGVVLSRVGGMFPRVLLPFRMGLGGVLGSGAQYLGWITLDDVIGAIHHLLAQESIQGPVNLVAPDPVTNYQFTKTLGRVLRRPTIVPVPAFALRLLLGEMAEELLLASTRVEPKALRASGYAFRHPQLDKALEHLLGS